MYILTNAGYKYSNGINDLSWDAVVTSPSFVRLVLTVLVCFAFKYLNSEMNRSFFYLGYLL